jgi:hypothetical protein
MSMSFFSPAVASNVVWENEYEALSPAELANPANFEKALFNVGGILTWRFPTPLFDGSTDSSKYWWFTDFSTTATYSGANLSSIADAGAGSVTTGTIVQTINPISRATDSLGDYLLFTYSNISAQSFQINTVAPSGNWGLAIFFTPTYGNQNLLTFLADAGQTWIVVQFYRNNGIPGNSYLYAKVDTKTWSHTDITDANEFLNNTPYILTLLYTGGVMTMKINGVLDPFTNNTGTVSPTTYGSTLQFGARSGNSPAFQFSGKLYDIAMTLNANDAKMQKYEGYLSWKYTGSGSMLPIGHPYKNSRPLA